MIDLCELNNHVTDEIDIDEVFTYDEESLVGTDIIQLENVCAKGKITKDNNDTNVLDLVVDGSMVIEDAISLKPVRYPFHIEFVNESLETILNQEENVEIDTNILDLKEILWQNIVLEVPLRYTEVEDFSTIRGDGWKLIDEDELKEANNPFNDLKKKLGEE